MPTCGRRSGRRRPRRTVVFRVESHVLVDPVEEVRQVRVAQLVARAAEPGERLALGVLPPQDKKFIHSLVHHRFRCPSGRFVRFPNAIAKSVPYRRPEQRVLPSLLLKSLIIISIVALKRAEASGGNDNTTNSSFLSRLCS